MSSNVVQVLKGMKMGLEVTISLMFITEVLIKFVGKK